MTYRRALAVALIAIGLSRPCQAADAPMLVFDTYVHYSRAAWQAYARARVLEKLDAAGVVRALVSSTPDDGMLMLHLAGGDRIVPMLRPYRGTVNAGN